MERSGSCAGYRNTHYRNGGYDSAKNSAGSLHFVANARVSPRQWNETLCLCMAINLIQKVVKDVNHCNASWHKMRRNVIGCINYFVNESSVRVSERCSCFCFSSSGKE